MGEINWNISPEFSDLFCETPVPQKYLPSFEHILLDYSNKSLELKVSHFILFIFFSVILVQKKNEKVGTHMLDFKLLNSQAFLNGELIFREFLIIKKIDPFILD